MIDEIKLGRTGRIRYRSHKPLFGRELLVLQLEETVSANEGTASFTDWRDARTEDLTTGPVQ